MEKQVIFKNAVVGGFDKDSVLDYIAHLNKQMKNNEEILNKKIEDLNVSNNDFKTKNEELTQTITLLQDEIRGKNNETEKDRQEISRNDAKVESLKQDVLRLNEMLNKTKRELEDAFSKNKELAYKYEKELDKNRKYEQSVMQIGSAMVEAQSKADVIVLEARNKIYKMSSDTENILKIAADKLDEFKLDVANLKSTVQTQLGSLLNKVNNVDSAIEAVQNKFVNYFVETKHIIEEEADKYIDINNKEKNEE